MIDIDDYTSKYKAQHDSGSFETLLVKVRRKHVLRFLEETPGGHIVEVGCGMEPLFPYLESFQSVTIVEPSKEFSRHAVSLAKDSAAVTVIADYFENAYTHLQGKKVDAIVVSSLLHEVPDPSALLRAAHTICQARTKVHINVPNMHSFHRLLALEMGLIESVFQKSEMDVRLQHQTHFDMTTLIDLVQRSGFAVESSGSYLIKPFTHHQLDRMLALDIVPKGVIDGLERMIKYMPNMGCEIYVNLAKA